MATPDKLEFGLLPERPISWRTLATSYGIEVFFILLLLGAGFFFPDTLRLKQETDGHGAGSEARLEAATGPAKAQAEETGGLAQGGASGELPHGEIVCASGSSSQEKERRRGESSQA